MCYTYTETIWPLTDVDHDPYFGGPEDKYQLSFYIKKKKFLKKKKMSIEEPQTNAFWLGRRMVHRNQKPKETNDL